MGREARLLGGSFRVGVAEAKAAKAETRTNDFILNNRLNGIVGLELICRKETMYCRRPKKIVRRGSGEEEL